MTTFDTVDVQTTPETPEVEAPAEKARLLADVVRPGYAALRG